MRRKAFRRSAFGAILAALLGFFGYAFWPRPIPVDMALVEKGPMRVTVDEEGETRVRDVYTLSAPITGRLLRIRLDVGDEVRAGETLVARILPSDPEFLDERSAAQAEAAVRSAAAAVEQARADRQRALAEVDFAEAELARAEELFKSNTISKAALDRFRLDLRRARAAAETTRAAVVVREAELENARARLMRPHLSQDDTIEDPRNPGVLPVYAPVDGRVLRLLRESETVVRAGAPLIEIGDTRDLEIVTDLLSTDAVRVRAGAPVIVQDWGGERPLNGMVRRVEPFGFTKVSALGIEEQRVNVIIDFTDPPEQRRTLGHGFRVETRIVVWQTDNALQIPTGALFRDGGDWATFLVNNDRARLTRLALGRNNGRTAQVLEGLNTGARVILHPGDRVEDGVRVIPR